MINTMDKLKKYLCVIDIAYKLYIFICVSIALSILALIKPKTLSGIILLIFVGIAFILFRSIIAYYTQFSLLRRYANEDTFRGRIHFHRLQKKIDEAFEKLNENEEFFYHKSTNCYIIDDYIVTPYMISHLGDQPYIISIAGDIIEVNGAYYYMSFRDYMKFDRHKRHWNFVEYIVKNKKVTEENDVEWLLRKMKKTKG